MTVVGALFVARDGVFVGVISLLDVSLLQCSLVTLCRSAVFVWPLISMDETIELFAAIFAKGKADAQVRRGAGRSAGSDV